MCSKLTRQKSGSQWRNFYGRFKGKSLSAKQSETLRVEFAKYSIKNISWEENPQRKPLNLTKLFAKKNIWLEIGFGGGEHLMHQAKLNPDIGIIICILILLKSLIFYIFQPPNFSIHNIL